LGIKFSSNILLFKKEIEKRYNLYAKKNNQKTVSLSKDLGLSEELSRLFLLVNSGLREDEKILIAQQMGWAYPASSVGEFVAEMFAGLMGGKKFSLELCNLYEKYEGPLPPQGFKVYEDDSKGFNIEGVKS
jgi:hypothetical protein